MDELMRTLKDACRFVEQAQENYVLVVKERDTLREACRQARACLLNLQPDEVNPVQRQMQKMVHELSVALGDCERG